MNQTACYVCGRCRTGTGAAGLVMVATGVAAVFSGDSQIIAAGLVLAGLALFWRRG